MRAKQVYEFSRNNDPKSSLGIGLKGIFMPIFNEMINDNYIAEEYLKQDRFLKEDLINNLSSALIWATIYNRIEYVDILLEYGADFTFQDYSAPIDAIYNEKIEILKKIIDNGLNLNEIKNSVRNQYGYNTSEARQSYLMFVDSLESCLNKIKNLNESKICK